MEKLKFNLDGIEFTCLGYNYDREAPWEKLPRISGEKGDERIDFSMDKGEVIEMIGVLERMLDTFPESEIKVGQYVEAVKEKKYMFPEDFEIVRYKNGMALGASAAETLNVLWIPTSCGHANAYVCMGELNEVDGDKEEGKYGMAEIKGLKRMRSKRLDLDF